MLTSGNGIFLPNGMNFMITIGLFFSHRIRMGTMSGRLKLENDAGVERTNNIFTVGPFSWLIWWERFFWRYRKV